MGLRSRVADVFSLYKPELKDADIWEEKPGDEGFQESVHDVLDLEAGLEIALFQAVQNDDCETISELIDAGVFLNCQDADTLQNALHIACSQGHVEVAYFLIAAGINVHARDVNGKLPLEIANDLGLDHVARTVRDAIEWFGLTPVTGLDICILLGRWN